MSTTSPSLVPAAVRPSGLVTEAALVAVGVLLLALSAQVVIPLPFTPVPITGQTFAALLVGASYGSRRGLTTMAAYLVVGGLGAPFFAGGAGGWAVLTSASAGYLVGMLVAAGLVGWLAERRWDRRVGTAVAAMLAGNVVIYAFGLVWLAHVVGADLVTAWRLGAQPFLLGDLLKIALAGGVLPLAWRLLAGVTDRPD